MLSFVSFGLRGIEHQRGVNTLPPQAVPAKHSMLELEKTFEHLRDNAGYRYTSKDKHPMKRERGQKPRRKDWR